MTFPARQISVSIERSVADVYEFASNPENLPRWAEGLSKTTITRSGDVWIADSPMGQVKVKFAPSNPFGVMDHDVTLPSGEVNYNPFRVVKNGTGSEVIFSLYRLPSASDSSFEQDAKMIQADLLRLKSILQE